MTGKAQAADQKSIAAPAWHSQGAGWVLMAMDSRVEGLTAEEAAERLARHGPNSLPSAPRQPAILRFLRHFHNTLIYFLLVAAVAAALLGHLVDAGVILAVVVINAIVGFIQEGKAERALDAIRDMIAPAASVLRGGRRTSVPAETLAPGDIVLLEPGDRAPADLRLIRASGLLVDEAVLTGESVASEKHADPVAEDASLGDRSSMVFSGTLVAAGQGVGVAVATGAATEIGHISRLVGQVETLTTPLLRQINRFGERFTWVAIGGAALLFAFAVLVRNYSWDDALIVVVAMAVGVVPEGLPAVITITLAIGVQRMAARNAIIRRLPAVETLGATTIICSDKTGTLTRNEMTARRLVTAEATVLVEGVGYEPVGALCAEDGTPLPEGRPLPETTDQLARCGLLCNDAQLQGDDGRWRVEGDPMEGALVALAMKASLDVAQTRGDWPRLAEIPFDAEHRFMASLHRTPTGEGAIFVKGAPEQVMAMCDRAAGAGDGPLDADAWSDRIERAASEGERVLGFAWKAVEAPPDDGAEATLSFDDLKTGLVFLGLTGFIDPPRQEAVEAVARCRSAGMAVKMITGDHAATALAIARQLNLADDPRAVTGAALDSISDEDLRELALGTSVFARTNPEHKLRIVRALQASGAVVAMTGDGVNDAPSLKQADVGVAMGQKGTEAAKQASEMVLVDDNFATIANAVHEGRTVYDNIRKVIGWTLPTNGGEAVAVIIALLLGLTLPMTAVQILWINMVLTITLGLVLAFEPSEPNVMSRKPRRPDGALLTPFLVWRVIFVSILFVFGVFGIFAWADYQGLGIETGRTLVVNTLVMMQIFYLFNVRYLHTGSISWRGLLGTPVVLGAIAVVIVAQLAFTYAPVMHMLFDTRPVRLVDGLLVLLIGLAVFAILEVEKLVFRRSGLMDRMGGS